MSYVPNGLPHDPSLVIVNHELRHERLTDGTWTPACSCGWYSPNKEHAEFERHLRRENK